MRHVDIQSLKYTYAWLYGQLTTEWLSAKKVKLPVDSDDAEMADYEHVSCGKKLESRAKWEQSVFTETKVDHGAIEKMLRELFEATPEESPDTLPKALGKLRESVANFEQQFSTHGRFTVGTLHWAIKGLLASDLLTNEKREALRDFDSNNTILGEVADVLNMRLAALEDWSWGKEVLLEERRQLNGNFSIYMHEDLLQALFLQHIGVKWSVFFNGAFRKFRKTRDVWKPPGEKVSTEERRTRAFYLGNMGTEPSIVTLEKKRYGQDYFVSQLMGSEHQGTHDEEGDEEANFEGAVLAADPSAPRVQMAAKRKMTGGKAARRMARLAVEEAMEEEDEDMGFGLFDGSSEDEDDYDANKPRNPMAAKQGLLHLLSTDILVQTKLKGEITCFRSQIDSLYPSLPHATIKTVLAYFGISDKWLQFFARFLEAPLRFIDDELASPRQRRNGTPGSHVLSEVFAEVVSFCLDYLVNQRAEGEILWRLNDDFWFWSASQDKCIATWSTINDFTRTMGLKLNDPRTGAARMQRATNGVSSASLSDKLPRGQIRWGMLYLNPDSGRFEIDQSMVDTHIRELSRQLAEKGNSIFAWIQVWNSYASTFFTSNFGKPANCFGREHVDNMLATHKRIQEQVFASRSSAASGSFVKYLKAMIADRHGVENIPDGYFYFPTELGGLEIQSPFISLLQVRDAVLADHEKQFEEWQEQSSAGYRLIKKRFEEGKVASKSPHDFRPPNPDTFLSFEEYIKYPEELSYAPGKRLADLYTKLLEKPTPQAIESDANGEIQRALEQLEVAGGGKLMFWHAMEPYWKWVAQLYGGEMIERFGGFKIVDAGLLPMGMVGLFRSGRVQWQE